MELQNKMCRHKNNYKDLLFQKRLDKFTALKLNMILSRFNTIQFMHKNHSFDI